MPFNKQFCDSNKVRQEKELNLKKNYLLKRLQIITVFDVTDILDIVNLFFFFFAFLCK
jgi:hypothetical protein